VVRVFSDDDVTHVAGQVDPKSDIEVIETELLLADLQTLEQELHAAIAAASASVAGSPQSQLLV